MIKPELVLEANAINCEGSLWDGDGNRLLWVDIPNGEIHAYYPETGADKLILKTDQFVGTVVQRERGGLLAAMHLGIYSVDEETSAMSLVCNPEPDMPGNRFNDGKCDAAGRFWAGTMDLSFKTKGSGSLYRLGTDLSCTKMAGGITISNGIIWSQDNKTMYYTDTESREIWAYDYDIETGNIANKRTAIKIAKGEGGPDGFTLDAEGMLWVAQWGGWQVGRYDPHTGMKLCKIELPAAEVSSCAFGGAGLDELYITTAKEGLTEEQLASQPLAGSLFMAKVGVKGLPANKFKG